MRRMKKFISLVFLFSLNCSFGQLVTSTAQSPASLVQNVLLGQGVTVSNIQFNGSPASIGSFTATNTNLGINSGIIMTTGSVVNNANGPQGPNDKESVSFDNKAAGFSLLSNIIGGATTVNAAYLQMDIVPQSDTVRFKYVFGSEEYPKFAPPNSSTFNDVFAFFISGPGISGQQNIAKLGNGTTVSINNINAVTNSNYFIYNGDGTNAPYNSSNKYIQYNGFTTVLEAVAKVQCGETYHLILAISDVEDGLYDSGIFLEANSLKSKVDFSIDNEISYDAYGDKMIMAEGCTKQTITIKRSGNFLPATSIPVIISGTATSGLDYNAIPASINFAAGETQKQFTINALADIINEVTETIVLSFLMKDGCGNIKTIDKTFFIKDPSPLSVIAEPGSPVCPGDNIEIVSKITGGVGPFTYLWSPTNETTSSIFVNPTSSSVYKVTVSDNCLAISASGQTTVTVPKPDPLTINPTNDITEICPYISNILESNVTGGTRPYVYSWNNEFGNSIGSDSSVLVTPSKTTFFTISVKDRCGLTDLKKINYTILSPELTLQMAPNIEICPGDSVLVWVKPSGGHPVPDWMYFYDWKGNLIKDSSFWVNPMVTSTYTVQVSDSCQTFFVEGSMTITVVKPKADFDVITKPLFNNLLVAFENLTINGDHYTWNLGNGVNSTLVHPTNTYADPGTYFIHLVAYDKKGCIDSITKPITIEEEYYVYVPNTFTPDGGRMNEFFKASTIGIRDLEIIICNRWGEVVFQSNDQYFRWDGMFKGVPAQDGIYAYKIKSVTNSMKTLNFVGHVGIIR